MLLQILEYMRCKKIVSDQQLAREFHLAKTALQPMLDIFLRRGFIAYCVATKNCQSRCFKCQTSPIYYRYCTNSLIDK